MKWTDYRQLGSFEDRFSASDVLRNCRPARPKYPGRTTPMTLGDRAAHIKNQLA